MSKITYKIIEGVALPESIVNDNDKYLELTLPETVLGVINIADVHKTAKNGKIKIEKSKLKDGIHTPTLVMKNSTVVLCPFKYEMGLFVFLPPKNEEIFSLWENLLLLKKELKNTLSLTQKIKEKVFNEKIF